MNKGIAPTARWNCVSIKFQRMLDECLDSRKIADFIRSVFLNETLS